MKLVSIDDLNIEIGKLYKTGLKRGIRMPWPAMDSLFSIAPEQHTLVTGIPGSGKSEWLDSMLVEVLRSNPTARVAYYSPENKPHELHLAKLMQKYVGMPFYAGPSTRMTGEEAAQSFRWINDRVRFIDEGDRSRTIFEVMSVDLPIDDVYWWQPGHAERNAVRERPFFLVIDPWNYLDKRRNGNETEADYLSGALSRVDQFVHATGAHVFIVAHPKVINKEKDGTRAIPTPYDVSGGAHWFNKMDNIICVHRTDKTDHRSPVQIHVQKVRFQNVGEIGVCELKYDKVTGRYSDWPITVTKQSEQSYRD